MIVLNSKRQAQREKVSDRQGMMQLVIFAVGIFYVVQSASITQYFGGSWTGTTEHNAQTQTQTQIQTQTQTPTATKTEKTKTETEKTKTETKTQRYAVPEGDPTQPTLAILYPTGMYGGYRNQVMRFTYFIKHAQNAGVNQLLMPTLVWATRYHQGLLEEKVYSEVATPKQDLGKINKGRMFWPVPFEELYDVEHWNSFHKPESESESESRMSLPLLVNSLGGSSSIGSSKIEEDSTGDSTGDSTDLDDYDSSNGQFCWSPGNNKSIVSATAIRNNTLYKNTFHDTFLPLLTQRMLFDTPSDNSSNNNNNNNNNNDPRIRSSFVLNFVQSTAVEFLVGKSMSNFHKVYPDPRVVSCTRPLAVSGAMYLWSGFRKMKLRSPEVVPDLDSDSDSDSKDQYNDEDDRRLRRRRLQDANTNANNTRTANTNTQTNHRHQRRRRRLQDNEHDPKRLADTLLQKTVYNALIPAQPWRRLANKCKHVHMGKASSVGGDGGGGGYITLHPRIEPELMSQGCGAWLEHNLTVILNMIDDFAENYNRNLTESNFYHNTTNTGKRKGKRRRRLEGILMAVSRKELVIDRGSRFHEIANYNWKKINERSISYDTEGNELITSRIRTSDANDADATDAADATLPLFECGEDWVDNGFYRDIKYQTELFSHPKAGALYERYAAQSKDFDGEPILPLPSNYYGDLLPSITNFWLALRADVFIGVTNSTWSTDVMTTRYYLGKGDGNYEITASSGLLKIQNGGMPPVHKC